MSSTNNKILLAGKGRRIELPTITTITPGMLIEQSSAGNAQVHSSQGGFFENIFAEEDALQGRTTADNYVTGDRVQGVIAERGDIVNVMLRAGYNYTVGTQVISYGDGTGYPTTGTPKKIVGTVIEAVDLSASGTLAALGRVRIQ